MLGEVEELRRGLWTWTAPHPEWREQPVVRSYAVEHDDALLLIDPVAPPEELTSGRSLQVALTCPWHARSAPGLEASPAELDSQAGFYPEERVIWLARHNALVFAIRSPAVRSPTTGCPMDARARTTGRGSSRCSARRSSSFCRPTATPAGAHCSSGRSPPSNSQATPVGSKP